MNILQQIIEAKKLSLPQVAAATGIKYNTVFRHAEGSRKISPEMALLYERGLGVPRAMLRPDIFAQFQPDEQAEPDGAQSAPEPGLFWPEAPPAHDGGSCPGNAAE